LCQRSGTSQQCITLREAGERVVHVTGECRAGRVVGQCGNHSTHFTA